MVNDTIVTVEDMGKKYHIRHEQAERYTALRNVIVTRASALLRSLLTILVFVFIFGRIAGCPPKDFLTH